MNRRTVRSTLALTLGTLVAGSIAIFGGVPCNAADPKPAKPVAGEVIKDPTAAAAKSSVLDQKVKNIKGQETDLSQYKGKVVMIVNVASKCGNTPQYKPLEALYEKYKDQGFVVVAFPANEFGKQEPGTDEQIEQFCTSKYNVTFPVMSKIVVKGEGIHPLYAQLTSKETGGEFAGDIQWNFQKFLLDRNGNVYARLAPKTQPDDPKVVGAIEKGLAAKPADGK